MNEITLAFITGLTTGGISCLAVQGGLLATTLTQPSLANKRYTGVGIFLAAKIVAYTLLGFALGSLGSAVSITPTVQGWMQIAAGLFMLVTAANLMNLHPFFRHFVIQPPKWALKMARNQSRTESYFAPALLGAATVLIPCGITQGMMVLAISSGNPFLGAGILAAFTIGTSPLFFGLGAASSALLTKKSFAYVAAAVILVLAVTSINSGQSLRGSFHTIQNYKRALFNESESAVLAKEKGTVQEVTIDVTSFGYTASANTLKVGEPVKLTLNTKNTGGCARSFTIPSMKISKLLPETGTETVEFTPKEKGTLTYTCSMGMYTGTFSII